MDVYCYPQTFMSREQFLQEQGIAPDRRLLLFACYPATWDYGEEALLDHLIIHLQEYAPNTHLMIRPHPRDSSAEVRFARFTTLNNVTVEMREVGRLHHLANLLSHVDVLITPHGTMALDAAALDTCTINTCH